MTIKTLKQFINILPIDTEVNDVKIKSRKDNSNELQSALDVDYVRDSKTNDKYLIIWTE